MTDPQFTIRGIPAPLVDRFWHLAEPYVKRALDHTSGELNAQDIRRLCKDRAIQLWLVREGERVLGAASTEIVVYPQRKHARVITLAGSRAPEWTGLLDTILNDWARSQGCAAIEAFVRKGYVPKLMEYGYKHKYSVVTKELSES